MDAAGSTTTFQYDPNGNLRVVTEYLYDVIDRLVARRDPGPAHEETFGYDANGNLITHTDRRGLVTAFGYDALDRWTFSGFHRTEPLANPSSESTISVAYQTDPTTRSEDVVLTDSRWPTPLTLDHDAHDRLVAERGPRGSVAYSDEQAVRGRDTPR